MCWKFSIFEVSVLIAFCHKLLSFEGMANSVHQALNSDWKRRVVHDTGEYIVWLPIFQWLPPSLQAGLEKHTKQSKNKIVFITGNEKLLLSQKREE